MARWRTTVFDGGGFAGPVVSFLAGLAAASGQIPWSLWPLALAGFATLIFAVARAPSLRGAGLRAWAGGSGYFLLSLHWITEPFQVDAARDGWMAPFALVLLALGLGLFWLAAALIARVLHRAMPPAGAFALLLALSEALRGMVLTGFPWALPGHIWIGLPPGQLAALTGAGGLSLLTLLLACLPLLHLRRGAVAALGLLALVWGWGAWREAAPPLPDREAVVRLVQPDADQALKWDPAYARMFFERHLDLTAAGPGQSGVPDLILWPETAVPFLLDNPRGGLEAILSASGDIPVALGIQRTEGLRGYNSLALLSRDTDGRASPAQIYDKHHLVPFGEYIPFGDQLADWLGIFSFSPREGYGYSAGPGPALMDLGSRLGTAQPLICYEAVFPWFQRAVARPDWLMQITNDAWFGLQSGPYQHLGLARLRAIENGLPMLRVANTGVSAVIGPRGEIRAELGMKQQGIIDHPLPAALAPTLYSRVGPFGAVALWLIFGFCLLLLPKVQRSH